jgi:hypothetical protein
MYEIYAVGALIQVRVDSQVFLNINRSHIFVTDEDGIFSGLCHVPHGFSARVGDLIAVVLMERGSLRKDFRCRFTDQSAAVDLVAEWIKANTPAGMTVAQFMQQLAVEQAQALMAKTALAS